jgi:hypothetical protein
MQKGIKKDNLENPNISRAGQRKKVRASTRYLITPDKAGSNEIKG